MKNVVKKVFLFCLLILAGFQFSFAQEIQNAKFSLSTETVNWKKGKPVIVKGSIENLTDSKFELPKIISFRLINETGDSFYMFYGFTKTNAKGCQGNLIVEDPEKVKGADEISAERNLVSFAGGEKKNFSVDLNRSCWENSTSSFRGAGKNLFETVAAGRYQLYFEMGFYGGAKENDGKKYPTAVSLFSNKIEIEIKQ